MKPFVQLGFMPEALSSAPAGVPYRHFWRPGDPYNDIYTGWTYAPRDYRKWEELCYQVTRHFVGKYGRDEVESWWFELWNEPDIGYWSGSVGRASAGRIRWRRRKRRRGARSSTGSSTSRSKVYAAPCQRRGSAVRK